MRQFFSHKLETEQLSIIATAMVGLGGTLTYIVVFSLWLHAPEIVSFNLKVTPIYLLLLIRALTLKNITVFDRYGLLMFFNAHIGWLLIQYFSAQSGIQFFIPAGIIATILINPLDHSKVKYLTILIAICLFTYIEFFNQYESKVYSFSEEENRILYYSTLTAVSLGLGLIAVSFTLSFRRLHKNLEQAANVDMLTGLRSRRKLILDLEQQLATTSKEKKNLCVALIDIDHFKSVNDTYGHAIGDKALKITATTMQKIAGANGIVGRVGGEEFCMVIPSAGEQLCCEQLELVRQTIARQPIYTDKDNYFTTTISIGFTNTMLSKDSVTSLLSDADKALYIAKREGRNNTVQFRPSVHA